MRHNSFEINSVVLHRVKSVYLCFYRFKKPSETYLKTMLMNLRLQRRCHILFQCWANVNKLIFASSDFFCKTNFDSHYNSCVLLELTAKETATLIDMLNLKRFFSTYMHLYTLAVAYVSSFHLQDVSESISTFSCFVSPTL